MTESLHPPHPPHPPVALERSHSLVSHGDERIDPWYWLRERDNPEVIQHLESENSYTAAVLANTQGAQQQLYDEIIARIQETDLSVPVKKGVWWYYYRTEEGKQYGIHCRKPDINGVISDNTEIVLFDENIEAGDSGFFDMGAFDITPDGNLLAYSIDLDGDEVFTMHLRDLQTGEDLVDVIEDTSYGTAWSKDGSVLFYVRRDEAQRPFQIWRHIVGQDASTDEMLYQEDDQRFNVGVGNSRTEDYIFISVGSPLTTEVRILRADNPLGEFALAQERRTGIEYHLSHHRSNDGTERFFVITNENAPNFKLMVTDIDKTEAVNWKEVIGHRFDVKLDSAESFIDHLILSERGDANTRIAIYDLATSRYNVLEQPEPVYTAHSSGNAEFETSKLRFGYTSLVTPSSVFEVDLKTNERKLLKQQPVLGTFNPDEYVSERQWAVAKDGTKVPISLVYRKDRIEEPGPTLLYGYGSYEISIDPTFSSLRLSLLDRGFVFAIAHIRGGGDLGRAWYDNGKFLKKKNTFTDFIACAEHLIEKGYTTSDQLVIRGGSAGGLLMGAVVNMRPDLFAAVVAEVPFVDTLTTMLDASLPLTVGEYEEWGNPEDRDYYDYIKSYSPYDNVTDQPYPQMLVTAGLNDPRVSYWEPAKWVQKLRRHTTSGKQILLKTEMGAGHSGPSGRYDTWRDEAFNYAFILHSLDIRIRLA